MKSTVQIGDVMVTLSTADGVLETPEAQLCPHSVKTAEMAAACFSARKETQFLHRYWQATRWFDVYYDATASARCSCPMVFTKEPSGS